MSQENSNASGWTRRELLGGVSLAAAGIAAATLATSEPATAAPRSGAKHAPLQSFKYDIESSRGWFGPGGSAKEANVEEFPISESMAGVSMRLKPGGLRELHWHAVAAEWAYVITGNVRATVIAPNGQAESADFAPGDVWYFPKGHGHAL
ncbi:MAG TPA: cupin domain-containing protein, partial [Terriglobales bacterium]|nr:cupin domain-containing protein [Terriglobales bacterium]